MNHPFLKGIGVSLFLHGIALCSVLYFGALMPASPPPLIIDFSITKGCTGCPSCNCSQEIEKSANEKPPLMEQENPITPAVTPEPEPTFQSAQMPENEPKPEPVSEKPVVKQPAIKQIVPIKNKKKKVVQNNQKDSASEPAVEPETSQTAAPPTPLDEQELTSRVPVSPVKEQVSAQNSTPTLKENYIRANFSYILETVQSNINYPNIALKMGWAGKVVVTFTIYPDGRVEDIRVTESCGFRALDKSAIKTIERSAPFPKPPVRAEISIPISYKLE